MIYGRVAQVSFSKYHFAAKARARSYKLKDSSIIDLFKSSFLFE